MNEEEKTKWTCKACTYSNFPASKKCTICLAPRNSRSVQDRLDFAGGMCSSQCDSDQPLLIIPPSPKSNTKSSNTEFHQLQETDCLSTCRNVWVCKSCTYENSLNTSWCSSCHFNKDTITLSEMNMENSRYAAQETPKAEENRAADPSKWICELCTYSNYLASNACIMCKHSKDAEPKNSEVKDKCVDGDTLGSLSTTLDGVSLSTKLPTTFVNTNLNKSLSDFDLTKNSDISVTKSESSTNDPVSNLDWNQSTGLSSKESNNENCESKLSRRKSTQTFKKMQMSSPTSSHNATCSNSVYSKNVRDADHRLYKKRKRSQLNRLFLKACIGVVDDHFEAVAAYIANGGNMSRAITVEEAKVMNRPSAFNAGFTLVHLAIRFQRQNILSLLLDPQISSHPFKRTPSNLSPDIADIIQKEINSSLRCGKDDFGCQFFSEFTTFQLPVEIYDLPPSVRKVLLSELIDEHAQKELEEDSAINWLPRLGKNQPSWHLYALWNRSAGDCLLDSVLQATWGVFDSNNSLRMAMSESLHECSTTFFCRWRDWEVAQAHHMGFTFNERQCFEAWSDIHALAQQPGASLEHCHIFVLSHILRRPIIVYGIKYLKSFRGETLGFCKFQGVYLPFFWDRSFCYTSPIALGYTRGHFTALVSLDVADDTDTVILGGRQQQNYSKVVHLPLIDCEGNVLPIHFTAKGQVVTDDQRREVLYDWLDCDVTDDHLLVAKQRVGKRPPSMTRMLDEWLDHYRHISFQQTATSLSIHRHQGNSSEGENDDDD